ncbi:MAG TPA: glycosyltransferase family 9 protein [Pyrinomonadaceae bacterium]
MIPEHIRTLATFAPLELGDTILATPLYRALRGSYPDAHFTLLSQLPNHPVLEGFNTFDSIENYNLETDLSGFDLVVLPVLCGDSDVRRHFENHPNVISADRLYASRRRSFTNKWNGQYSHVLFYKHQVELNMELACETGYEGRAPTPYCPRGDASQFAQQRGKVGLFINTPMNEFQAMVNRQWPIEHWKALIDRVGVSQAVLIGGRTDRPNVERLADETNAPFVVTDSLAEFTALCGVLKLLVTTDGGAMHAAATSGVPLISLHGTSSPVLLHPWIYPDGKCIAVLSPNTCSPCQRSYRLQACEGGLTHMDCMQNLRPEFIERAISEIEILEPGTCLIMKGKHLMTKTSYLKSWKRALEFTLNYNTARVAVRITSRRRPRALTSWNPVEHSNTGN